MKDRHRPLLLQSDSEPEAVCPFCWNCHSASGDATSPVPGPFPDIHYIQARRQGIYLAACIIDEVAALGMRTPQAVVDEIRRRICELVRYELSGSPARHKGER